MRILTNNPQGKRKSSSKPQGPKRACLPLHLSQMASILTTLTEGEAPHNLPMPLLQPRKVRLRLHREEIRRRQPPM
jgi:hypothetical protein